MHSDTSRKLPRGDIDKQIDVQRFVLTVDEFTGRVWIRFVQRKDQVKHAVDNLVGCINNEQSPNKVAEHQSDGGAEFKNKILDKKFAERGVVPRNSDPHCQYQNGLIESEMEVIDRWAKAMWFRGNAPEADLPYAYRHAVYLRNILPDVETGTSRMERWDGVAPRETPQTIKGTLFCKCLAKVYRNGKLESKARPCIYMGKSDRTPGHLVRLIGGKRASLAVYPASVVTFDITDLPYTNPQVPRKKDRKTINYGSDTDHDSGGENLYLSEQSGEESQSMSEESDTESGETENDEQNNDEYNENKNDNNKDKKKDEEGELNPIWNKIPQWKPDGKIGNSDAYEVEKIYDERRRKIRGRKRLQYKIKWKDQEELEWIDAARLQAPKLIEEWKERNGIEEKQQNSTIIMQLNQAGEPEAKPLEEQKLPEANPFQHLFNPKTQSRIPDPRHEGELQNHPYKRYFIEARLKEKMQNLGWGTYIEIPRSEVPAGQKILKVVTAYLTKYNARGEIEKFKTRVCLNGSRVNLD